MPPSASINLLIHEQLRTRNAANGPIPNRNPKIAQIAPSKQTSRPLLDVKSQPISQANSPNNHTAEEHPTSSCPTQIKPSSSQMTSSNSSTDSLTGDSRGVFARFLDEMRLTFGKSTEKMLSCCSPAVKVCGGGGRPGQVFSDPTSNKSSSNSFVLRRNSQSGILTKTFGSPDGDEWSEDMFLQDDDDNFPNLVKIKGPYNHSNSNLVLNSVLGVTKNFS